MLEILKIEFLKFGAVIPFSTVFTSVGFFLFGEISNLHILLIYAVIVDFVLGVINYTFYNKGLNSTSMAKGIFKKFMYFVIISVIYQIDKYSLTEVFGLGETNIVSTIVIIGFILTEILSIFEHAIAFNVPLPKFLIEALTNRREKIYNAERIEDVGMKEQIKKEGD